MNSKVSFYDLFFLWTTVTWMIISLNISTCHGFSATPPSSSSSALPPPPQDNQQQPEQRQFIEITNPIDVLAENRLPASFVRDWPTWILERDGTLTKIPDAEDDDGFVSPASVDELWQPVDLKRPNVQLALGMHVRGGVIRQVMPAVDLSFGQGIHRNRGMCSVPRAHGWIDFTTSLDEWDNYEIVLEERGKGNEEEKWTEVVSSSPGVISKAIERGMVCLAESAPAEMGQGSHFIHVLLDDNDYDDDDDTNNNQASILCPKSGSEMRVTMTDDALISGRDMAPGVLEVVVTATIAGSESEYLPDAYKPLFEKESPFLNPLYFEFKERRREADNASDNNNSNNES